LIYRFARSSQPARRRPHRARPFGPSTGYTLRGSALLPISPFRAARRGMPWRLDCFDNPRAAAAGLVIEASLEIRCRARTAIAAR
jgi:hypothetical protein